ncbi:MAG TPA: Uma2 family endonuclease [Polyangiaceae bacterium]|nr:Uma2 family endonuclease [Polyangiaceae bacterium]
MLGSDQPAIFFPVSAEMPEGKRHFELRTLVYDFLKLAFEDVALIGCDQFVYWDPGDPRANLAPDACLRFGAKDEQFQSWKVWERGVPQVAVEIISDSDASELSWAEKLQRYRRLGVSELVWFDPGSPEHSLRIWDFVGDDLLERRLFQSLARSHHLPGYWLTVREPNGGLTLRLSRDKQGLLLFPTSAEQNAQARRAAEDELKLKTEALAAAERRIAELEANLGRRGP